MILLTSYIENGTHTNTHARALEVFIPRKDQFYQTLQRLFLMWMCFLCANEVHDIIRRFANNGQHSVNQKFRISGYLLLNNTFVSSIQNLSLIHI